jgi:hypothetical protein
MSKNLYIQKYNISDIYENRYLKNIQRICYCVVLFLKEIQYLHSRNLISYFISLTQLVMFSEILL